MLCKACNEGTLIEKQETLVKIELEVYEFHIDTSFLSCNTCCASIIPKTARDKFRKDLNFKRQQLYYN